MHLHSLGYLGVESPAAAEWADFATDVFGLEVELDGPAPERVRVRWDDRPFRLAVEPGPVDRLAHLGWEAATRQDLRASVEHAEAAGCTVHGSTEQERARRMVREMVWLEDPFGLRHEVFQGSIHVDRSFRGGRSTSGFVTGAKGLGHAVLAVPSHEEALPFYEGVLGLRLSDVVSLGEMGSMMFLRCNGRHHSVALWEMPGLLGLQHVMLESADVDDVGRSYDRVQASRWDVAATLGRHVGDEQLSFYTRSPSGFDLELGCDSVDVVEAEWSARWFDVTAGSPNEVWGHHWQHLAPQSSLHPYPAGTGASR